MSQHSRLLIAVLAVLCTAAMPEEHCARHPAPADSRFSRSVHQYELPNVDLVDHHGKHTSLLRALPAGEDTAVNFIFTTCTTICPVMSATFAGLAAKVGGLNMVSISIDPEFDRPEVLRNYAGRFQATPAWHFYSGKSADIRAVLTAFDAYFGDKSKHRPVTLLRRANSSAWVRVEGFAGADDLASVFREMRAAR